MWKKFHIFLLLIVVIVIHAASERRGYSGVEKGESTFLHFEDVVTSHVAHQSNTHMFATTELISVEPKTVLDLFWQKHIHYFGVSIDSDIGNDTSEHWWANDPLSP